MNEGTGNQLTSLRNRSNNSSKSNSKIEIKIRNSKQNKTIGANQIKSNQQSNSIGSF
jgi:hypothetical protein